MEAIFITIAFVLILWQAVLISGLRKKVRWMEKGCRGIEDTLNQHAKGGNEHLRAFKELAGLLGYQVDQEHTVAFCLKSILGGESPKHTKKLIISKKPVVRKVPVKHIKTGKRK